MNFFLHQVLRVVIFIGIISLSLSEPSFSQIDVKKKSIYKVWVNYVDTRIKMKGYLYQVKDSSIVISGVKPTQNIAVHKNFLYEISYEHIDVIKIRRKGRLGRGVLIGIGIGFVSGILIGYISGDDPPSYYISMTAGEKAIAAAVPLAITGGIIGAFIGSNKKKINISGDFENFKNSQNKLRK